MDELKKLPPVTRTVLAAVFAVTLPVLLQLVSIYPVVFVPQRITTKLELWRLVTPFLYGGKGIPLIFDAFLLFRGLSDLEESHFQRKTAEMTWALILICGGILTVNLPLHTPILYHPLLLAVTHLWAQTNPTNQVSLFGLIQLKAPYFPFALVLLDLVQGGPGYALQAITGIVAAHAYFFAAVIYPRQNGGSTLSFFASPSFLINLLGNGPTAAPTAGAAGSTYRTGGGWGFRPAGGQRLGATPGSAGGMRSTSSTPTSMAGEATVGSSATARQATTEAGHRWGRGNRLGEE